MIETNAMRILPAKSVATGGSVAAQLGRLPATALVCLFLIAATGCEDKGPLEEAAEETGEALEHIGDEVEDATTDEGTVEEAAEEVQDAAEDVADELEDAADEVKGELQ